ncbi:uncharacterized protein LOC143463492 [Clavelina lepadiformis]|uniref:uncharacterized protein LOC143463492 n=1 Tax=Clavelina lepadiformis TaxID=159417 RepID=UPI004042D9BE
MKIFIEVAIFLFLFVVQGSTIRCYECQYNSVTTDNSCYGPNIDDQYLKTCPAGQDHCLTSVGKASAAGVDAVAIVRQCSPTTAGTSCQTQTGVQACVYFCSKDGCNNGNSGSLVQASLVTLLLAMFGALALIKW